MESPCEKINVALDFASFFGSNSLEIIGKASSMLSMLLLSSMHLLIRKASDFSVSISDDAVVDLISGWLRITRLKGCHPLSSIAILFVAALAKLSSQVLLISSISSVGASLRFIDDDNFNATMNDLSLVSDVLKCSFYSYKSPACQREVPYGTLTHPA